MVTRQPPCHTGEALAMVYVPTFMLVEVTKQLITAAVETAMFV